MVEDFTIYDLKTGQIVGLFSGSTRDLGLNTPDGCSALIGHYDPKTFKVENGQPVEKGGPSLAELKQAKWREIKAFRSEAEFGGFTWDGSPFDSDDASQRKIMTAAQMASVSPDLILNWTLADNTQRTLSDADILSVGMALGAHINDCHATGRNLRALIDAAATAEDVAAISWPHE